MLGEPGDRQTKAARSSLSLQYRVRMEYLRTQTLILSVWHHDTFGKNSFLGEVDVDLSKWDFDHTQMNYLALKARVGGKTLAHSAALSTAAVLSSNNSGSSQTVVSLLIYSTIYLSRLYHMICSHCITCVQRNLGVKGWIYVMHTLSNVFRQHPL